MNKQWIRSIIVSVAIVVVILFVNSYGSFAQGNPFHWNHINVDIDVQENGDMLVTFPMVIFAFCFLAIFAVLALLIYRKHCPDCKKLTLKRTSKKSSYAKATGTGKTRVIHHCPNCSYHHEYIAVSTLGYSDSGYNGGSGGGYDAGSGGGYGGGDGGGSGD